MLNIMLSFAQYEQELTGEKLEINLMPPEKRNVDGWKSATWL